MWATLLRKIAVYIRIHGLTWLVPRCNGTRPRMTIVGMARPEKGVIAVAKVVIPS